MSIVSDVETIDDQYCFSLHHAGRDFVLFVFRTEHEARIARDALRQIAQHAVAILPAAEAGTGEQAATEAETSDGDNEAQAGAAPGGGHPEPVATSPFLGR